MLGKKRRQNWFQKSIKSVLTDESEYQHFCRWRTPENFKESVLKVSETKYLKHKYSGAGQVTVNA